MAEVFVHRRRSQTRRRGLGHVPLSSGEIAFLTRQDEAARRRQRLLHVREQEKRAAQLVTQRYRDNLKKLQGYRLKYARHDHGAQQDVLLSALHEKYQLSLQGMGAAQRNAREKVMELVETAQIERRKWTVNHRGVQERFDDALDAVEEDAALRLARRREIERNLTRLKEMSSKQRSEASARAKRELEMQLRQERAQEEAQRYRLQHAKSEEFLLPRKNRKDVTVYQFTRTHCVALPGPERTNDKNNADGFRQVKVVRHNRAQPQTVSALAQAETFRVEMQRKREEDRRLGEENLRVADSRGQEAIHVVESNREGERALNWLTSMDRNERIELTHQTLDHEPVRATATDNWAAANSGGETDAFARMFGIENISDNLASSDGEDGELEGPQHVTARRVDSVDESDNSLLFGGEQFASDRRNSMDQNAREPSRGRIEDHAIEQRLNSMNDLLQRVAGYGEVDVRPRNRQERWELVESDEEEARRRRYEDWKLAQGLKSHQPSSNPASDSSERGGRIEPTSEATNQCAQGAKMSSSSPRLDKQRPDTKHSQLQSQTDIQQHFPRRHDGDQRVESSIESRSNEESPRFRNHSDHPLATSSNRQARNHQEMHGVPRATVGAGQPTARQEPEERPNVTDENARRLSIEKLEERLRQWSEDRGEGGAGSSPRRASHQSQGVVQVQDYASDNRSRNWRHQGGYPRRNTPIPHHVDSAQIAASIRPDRPAATSGSPQPFRGQDSRRLLRTPSPKRGGDQRDFEATETVGDNDYGSLSLQQLEERLRQWPDESGESDASSRSRHSNFQAQTDQGVTTEITSMRLEEHEGEGDRRGATSNAEYQDDYSNSVSSRSSHSQVYMPSGDLDIRSVPQKSRLKRGTGPRIDHEDLGEQSSVGGEGTRRHQLERPEGRQLDSLDGKAETEAAPNVGRSQQISLADIQTQGFSHDVDSIDWRRRSPDQRRVDSIVSQSHSGSSRSWSQPVYSPGPASDQLPRDDRLDSGMASISQHQSGDVRSMSERDVEDQPNMVDENNRRQSFERRIDQEQDGFQRTDFASLEHMHAHADSGYEYPRAIIPRQSRRERDRPQVDVLPRECEDLNHALPLRLQDRGNELEALTPVPDGFVGTDDQIVLRQIHQEPTTFQSSFSSLQQYSLPLSDSFSSMSDSQLDFDTANTLTNQLVPLFPRVERAASEASTDDGFGTLGAAARAPVGGDTSVLLKDLASQDQAPQSVPQTSGRSSASSHRELGQLRHSPSDDHVARSSACSTHSDADENVIDEPARHGNRHSVVTGLEEERQHRDMSFSSDNSSEASAYSYLQKMRKMTGVSTTAGRWRAVRERQIGAELVSSEESFSGLSNLSSFALPNAKQQPVVTRHSDRRISVSSSSSSTPSIDARFQYLVNMTAVAGKALPLHLNLPPGDFERRDMRIPPPPLVDRHVYSSDSDAETTGFDQQHYGGAYPDGKMSSAPEQELDAPIHDGITAQVPSGQFRTSSHSDASRSAAQSSSAGARSRSQSDDDDESVRSVASPKPPPYQQFALEDLGQRLTSLPPPPFGTLDMSQPPPPLAWSGSEGDSQSEDESETSDSVLGDIQQDAEAEPVQKEAVAMFVPFDADEVDAAGQPATSPMTPDGMSLADAFQSRHPSFRRRAKSTKSLLEQRRQQLAERSVAAKDDALAAHPSGHRQPVQDSSAQQAAQPPRSHVASTGATAPTAPQSSELRMPKPELVGRLATGERAKISREEMHERTRRLYNQLPEVTERKRQEDVLERRRQRLAELREREKTRREQQRQRRDLISGTNGQHQRTTEGDRRAYEIGLKDHVHELRAGEERAQRRAEEHGVVLDAHLHRGFQFRPTKLIEKMLMLSAVGRAARRGIQSTTARPMGLRSFADAAPKPRAPVASKKRSKDARFVTVGMPLLLFVFGGYMTLTQFVGGKYEARDHKIKSQSTRAFDLDEEHKKMTKKLLTDDFELKPVPKLDEPRKG